MEQTFTNTFNRRVRSSDLNFRQALGEKRDVCQKGFLAKKKFFVGTRLRFVHLLTAHTMPKNKKQGKPFIYLSLAEQPSKVLWIIAVCQNHGFFATRGIIATTLKTTRQNISNILTQIKRKKVDYFGYEPLGVRIPVFIDPPADTTVGIDKEKRGYFVRIETSISTPNTSRMALAIENLYKQSDFLTKADLASHLTQSLGLEKSHVTQRLEFLLGTGYLEILDTGIIMLPKSERISAERYYLTLLADNPAPDFVSNISLKGGLI